jgi:hypothetical protein
MGASTTNRRTGSKHINDRMITKSARTIPKTDFIGGSNGKSY